MEKVRHRDIEVDRCTNCYGLWFDMLELEDLKAMKDSEHLDIGDSSVGRLYDAMKRVSCPSCSSRMIKMVDTTQPHLTYEACTVCYGVFFDAGELRDYKEETVLDFFKDLRLIRKRRS
jgi:Zn-finger nucleic acid-binding protein